MNCEICKKPDADRAHIKTRATGGTWDSWNIMPLCREHHQEQHRLGWYQMAEKYPAVDFALKHRGWHFELQFEVWKLARV